MTLTSKNSLKRVSMSHFIEKEAKINTGTFKSTVEMSSDMNRVFINYVCQIFLLEVEMTWLTIFVSSRSKVFGTTLQANIPSGKLMSPPK